jgi:UV DNA damage endonuclease
MTITKRIGFACKYVHPDNTLDAKKKKEIESKYNTKSVTRAWMNRQTKKVAEEKLQQVVKHNLYSLNNLINYVGSLEDGCKLLRISSDILPLYTEQYWSYYYSNKDTTEWLERSFSRIGDNARKLGIRLSFHPSQFTVLASDNPNVVENSIREFEYHADMIRWMGYGKEFQDMKCNVHIGGKLGPQGIRNVYPKLSVEARNTITIENDEFGWGLDSCLELVDIIPIVLDIHHHYIRTDGEYIQPTDSRINHVIDSWKGVRPVMHYSVSREEYSKCINTLPDMNQLLTEGHNKTKLRAHSDMLCNIKCNNWALSFWDNFDIMVEAKCKNLASLQLYNYSKKLN